MSRAAQVVSDLSWALLGTVYRWSQKTYAVDSVHTLFHTRALVSLLVHATDVLVCTCAPVHRQLNTSFGEEQGWD